MGPFEVMDLIGIDVNLAVARAIWEGLGRPDRLRPSPIQERLVAEGRLGRKAGEGFYRYEAGRRVAASRGFEGVPMTLPADEIRDAILAAIVHEARLASAEHVASEADIDVALRLGAAHPVGPLERARLTGGGPALPSAP
jgi:3-hydroxybutyryl-CoA dehydrogenase